MLSALILLCLAAAGLTGLRYLQWRSDGPLNGLVPGGALRSGELISDPAVAVPTVGNIIELQLADPLRSRYVGLFELDGKLYIPCDLGFVWGRFSGTRRQVMHLVYRFKRWHHDAVRNGDVVIRSDGKRYLRHAVRVTDPVLLAALRTRIEALARDWVAPAALGPEPTSGPRDIWFFRLDPRPAPQATPADSRAIP